MARLTLDQLVNKLTEQRKAIVSGFGVEIAAKTATAVMVQRIFEKGENSFGSPIGTYDTERELWVGDEKLPRRGSHKGKTGKTIKTTYYRNYRDLRQQQGRVSNKVNLRLNNRLQSDLSNSIVSKTANKVADPKPIKVDNLTYQLTLKESENQDKRKGLEKKYGTIFDLTEKERDVFRTEYQFQINKLLNA